MKTLVPKALRPGDTIGLVSPSSPSPDKERIQQAVLYLEKIGYRVKPARHFNCRADNRHELDRQKLHDLHEMFADRSVKGIFCLRGGSGATRLLQDIDYGLISKNPKILAGYSDITALSLAIYARSGLITFSGPMLATELHAPSPYTEEHFWTMLSDPDRTHEIVNHSEHPRNILRPGSGEGILIAGNLSVLSCLAGTPFMPSTKEAILLFEDINEEPYRIDRLLSHLYNAGLIGHCQGLLFGQFRREVMRFDCQQPLIDIFHYYTAKIQNSIPVAAGISYGHIENMFTLPIGASCRIVASDGNLVITTTAAVTR
ncbi:MAG: LD-carboxypeptidase [Prosthecochloris sp.]|uniref:S66 peptidase family protein n=1 Tax=Prosthecochloris sp. TaxID=290513 RepID=UPI0013CDD14E|nr:LD-carboxypeptidase [Prosthecochloris sp.]NEX12263.1 LD-carboxypeptidase [Prosthecochloris sp.]